MERDEEMEKAEIAVEAAIRQDDLPDIGLGPLGEKFVELVQKILDPRTSSNQWGIESLVASLVQFASDATEADVGYVRRNVGKGQLELLGGDGGVYWRLPDEARWGEVPHKKNVADCFNGNASGAFSLANLKKTACHSRDYQKTPAVGEYTSKQRDYLMGLGSVATIRLGLPDEQGPPRFILFLGHRNTNFFVEGSRPHQILERIQPLVDASFRQAEGVQDRFDKAQKLKDLTEALPPLALAASGRAFWRGVATILTAQKGFRFDRCMVFLWRGVDRAECAMAVGGMGGNWTDAQKDIAKAFEGLSLRDYVKDGLDYPEPGTGLCKIKDLLYESVCGKDPLIFRPSESNAISAWLKSIDEAPKPGLEAKPALELSSKSDSWIKKIATERENVFFQDSPQRWPCDQYFAFPLVALDAKGNRLRIGFVLADVSYTSGGHVPGIDMPDLEITSTVLHLIAGMWLARQQEEAYYHVLGAIEGLRHNGGRVGCIQDELARSLPDEVKSTPQIANLLERLLQAGASLGRAKIIVEGFQDKCLSTGPPTDPWAEAESVGHAAQSATLTFSMQPELPSNLADLSLMPRMGERVRIPAESLRQILNCILDNAAAFANNGDGVAVVRGSLCIVRVKEEGREDGHRILITLSNDGPPVDPDLAPFLFVDGVSTRPTKGHGTGLSTARQIAKAYGGDVVLLRPREPVTFGVVLPIAANPLNTSSQ